MRREKGCGGLCSPKACVDTKHGPNHFFFSKFYFFPLRNLGVGGEGHGLSSRGCLPVSHIHADEKSVQCRAHASSCKKLKQRSGYGKVNAKYEQRKVRKGAIGLQS